MECRKKNIAQQCKDGNDSTMSHFMHFNPGHIQTVHFYTMNLQMPSIFSPNYRLCF